jgi:hypothetical protein
MWCHPRYYKKNLQIALGGSPFRSDLLPADAESGIALAIGNLFAGLRVSQERTETH